MKQNVKENKSKKEMKNRRYKAGRIILLFGIFLAAMTLVNGISRQKEGKMTEEIAGKIIRFHVLGNSDSNADQKLKIKVRDAIGTFMQPKLSGIEDVEKSREIVTDNLSGIEEQASEIIAEEGYTYQVSAKLAKTDFPEKTYGAYTFPEGNYEALEVVIGSGEGRNWWCVMYPNMCFSNSTYQVVDEKAEESLEKILTPKEYKSLMENKEYKVKFALTDFLKDIRDSVAISH